MKTAAGLWIDHRKAIIVTISTEEEIVMQICSNTGKKLGCFTPTTSLESQQIKADGRQQSGFTSKHLDEFYTKVILRVKDAENVMVFGPDETKCELIQFMDEKIDHKRMVLVKTADKMTDHQIVANVHLYFSSIGAGDAVA